MKRCTRCGALKPLSEFYTRSDGKGVIAQCKDCIRAARRAAYAANPEPQRQATKRWRHQNPELSRQSKKRHRDANKDDLRLASKLWRRENPERDRENHRSWRQRNIDHCREYERAKRQPFYDFISRVKDVPCADCRGRFPPVAMDFDHREGEVKSFNISEHQVIDDALLQEIAKCDIVCACCHRIRTRARQGKRIVGKKELFSVATRSGQSYEEVNG